MSSSWHGGKGSAPRPKSVDDQEYSARWETIFGKKESAPGDEPAPLVMIDASGYAIDSDGVWHQVDLDAVEDAGDPSVLFYEHGEPVEATNRDGSPAGSTETVGNVGFVGNPWQYPPQDEADKGGV